MFPFLGTGSGAPGAHQAPFGVRGARIAVSGASMSGPLRYIRDVVRKLSTTQLARQRAEISDPASTHSRNICTSPGALCYTMFGAPLAAITSR